MSRIFLCHSLWGPVPVALEIGKCMQGLIRSKLAGHYLHCGDEPACESEASRTLHRLFNVVRTPKEIGHLLTQGSWRTGISLIRSLSCSAFPKCATQARLPVFKRAGTRRLEAGGAGIVRSIPPRAALCFRHHPGRLFLLRYGTSLAASDSGVVSSSFPTELSVFD